MKSAPALFVLVLLCVHVISAQEEDCPDSITECATDPCQDQDCNRFFNAECRPNLCFGGLCTANFFWRGRNVTDRCSVTTCDEKQCPPRRQCMEEVVPPECPPDRPGCRQYLRTRCVLLPDMDKPMTCKDISCPKGEACRFRARPATFPPVVRCVPASKVKDCVPGTCNDDEVCIDEGPSVRCIQSTVQPTTSPAVSAVCNDSLQMLCAANFTVCRDDGSGPRCALASSCSELEPVCNANSLVCTEESFGPFCSLASSCEELQPVCETRGMQCTDFNGFFICLPRPTCEGFVCSEFERCVLAPIGNITLTPICINATLGLTCDELVCPPDLSECQLLTIPSANATLATCTTEDAGRILNNTLLHSCDETFCSPGEICVDLIEDGQNAGFFCTVPNCISDQQCAGNFTCLKDPRIIVANSACVPSNADFNLGSSNCSTGVCPQGTACQVVSVTVPPFFSGFDIATFCNPFPVSPVPTSCDNMVCDVEGQVCSIIHIRSAPELSISFCENVDTVLDLIQLLQTS